MTIVDDTKGVRFPRDIGSRLVRTVPEGPRHAGPLPAYGPDPRSGVGKERARLMREHPIVWRDHR